MIRVLAMIGGVMSSSSSLTGFMHSSCIVRRDALLIER
jgi:hypothetical protein